MLDPDIQSTKVLTSGFMKDLEFQMRWFENFSNPCVQLTCFCDRGRNLNAGEKPQVWYFSI